MTVVVVAVAEEVLVAWGSLEVVPYDVGVSASWGGNQSEEVAEGKVGHQLEYLVPSVPSLEIDWGVVHQEDKEAAWADSSDSSEEKPNGRLVVPGWELNRKQTQCQYKTVFISTQNLQTLKLKTHFNEISL